MRLPALLWTAFAAAAAHAGPSLERAAVLYHKGLYDSALSVLESFTDGSLPSSDSAAYYQYAGMACALTGRDRDAEAHFRGLLAIDSLFQFPSNENPAILSAFAAAGASRRTVPEPAPDPGRDDGDALSDGADPGPAPDAPVFPPPVLSAPPLETPEKGVGRALGAIPMGAGWLMENRYPTGLAMALLQAGGAALSLYASSRAGDLERDPYGIRDPAELGEARKWQWVQRISLSTAVGAYLYSVIASGGK